MEKIAKFTGAFTVNMLTYTPAMLIALFGNPWFAIVWAIVWSIENIA